MSLRDVQTMHLSNMLARRTRSVCSFRRATMMIRIYLFTSSLVRYRSIEAKKCLRLARIAVFLQEPSRYCCKNTACWKEDTEDDYFRQKIEINPHLHPLYLQGELIMLMFYLQDAKN